MAAFNKTPLQHFRSRTSGVPPVSLNIVTSAAAASGDTTLMFTTTSLGGNNVLQWAIDAPSTIIASNTVVTATAVSGSNTVVTLSTPLVSACPTAQPIRLQQLREGELFINTADNRLVFGGYPQTPTGNSDTIGIIDLIPSIKNNAGLALRVADNGLSLQWGNVTAAGGAVNAVWAAQQTNPLTSIANQPSGLVTSPATLYTQNQIPVTGATGSFYRVVTISNQLTDGTYDLTVSPAIPLNSNDIRVGFVISDTEDDLNRAVQARVNLVRSSTVINVTVTTAAGTPWGLPGIPATNTIWQSGLGSSGIQGTGFVNTDVTVLPYMQARNRSVSGVTPYAAFNNTTLDTGISGTARNPSTQLPAPFVNAAANVVDLAQGGFGIGLTGRSDLVNAAAAQQTNDPNTPVATKNYADWTNNGFTPYSDGSIFYRQQGFDGRWPQWSGTNRQLYSSITSGTTTSVSWQGLPQPIQNVFHRLTNNSGSTRVQNKGLYFGTASWLGMAQNAAPDSTPGATPVSKISVRPDNQDLVLDLVQTAPVPISSGGTGIAIRGATSDTYWDVGNSRLTASLAWAIPAYNATRFDGELDKILPPFGYTADSNNDPSATTSYVMSYKAVGALPTWSSSLQGFQLQGAQLPATNTFNNSNRPLRLEGLGRFGVWNSQNSYSAYVADGTIQAPTQVQNQDLRLQGSTSATDSRLVIQQATTPTANNMGLHSVRIDSGLSTVNNGQGSSVNQIAEDYITATGPSITTDFTNSTVVLVNAAPNSGTSINVQLNHSPGTGRGSIANFLANGQKGISGVVFFTTATTSVVSKLNINVTTSGGLGTPVLLRPLAGVQAGEFLAVSWWSNGSQCIITVAAGN